MTVLSSFRVRVPTQLFKCLLHYSLNSGHVWSRDKVFNANPRFSSQQTGEICFNFANFTNADWVFAADWLGLFESNISLMLNHLRRLQRIAYIYAFQSIGLQKQPKNRYRIDGQSRQQLKFDFDCCQRSFCFGVIVVVATGTESQIDIFRDAVCGYLNCDLASM